MERPYERTEQGNHLSSMELVGDSVECDLESMTITIGSGGDVSLHQCGPGADDNE